MHISAMAKILQVNLFVYDYFGYGCSDGKLSEKHLYTNIECVYEHLTKTLGIPWQQIVALGSSLGAAATIHLASKFPVGAVVLERSFVSVMRRFCPVLDRYWCEGLASLDKIEKVKCPTLFVHGRNDTEFDVEHMFDHCPGAGNIKPLVIKGEGYGYQHFVKYPEYWARLAKFIQEEAKVMKPKDAEAIDPIPDEASKDNSED